VPRVNTHTRTYVIILCCVALEVDATAAVVAYTMYTIIIIVIVGDNARTQVYNIYNGDDKCPLSPGSHCFRSGPDVPLAKADGCARSTGAAAECTAIRV